MTAHIDNTVHTDDTAHTNNTDQTDNIDHTEDTTHTDNTTYRVTIDTDACDGIFACLVRDDRFVESDDGLATFDPEAVRARDADGTITAEFDDSRREDAESAAAACPPGAITVEAIDATDEVDP